MWELRERITECLLFDGYVFKYDISIPHENFYSPVEIMRERLGPIAVRVSGYGHIGSNNVSIIIPTYKIPR